MIRDLPLAAKRETEKVFIPEPQAVSHLKRKGPSNLFLTLVGGQDPDGLCPSRRWPWRYAQKPFSLCRPLRIACRVE